MGLQFCPFQRASPAPPIPESLLMAPESRHQPPPRSPAALPGHSGGSRNAPSRGGLEGTLSGSGTLPRRNDSSAARGAHRRDGLWEKAHTRCQDTQAGVLPGAESRPGRVSTALLGHLLPPCSPGAGTQSVSSPTPAASAWLFCSPSPHPQACLGPQHAPHCSFSLRREGTGAQPEALQQNFPPR